MKIYKHPPKTGSFLMTWEFEQELYARSFKWHNGVLQTYRQDSVTASDNNTWSTTSYAAPHDILLLSECSNIRYLAISKHTKMMRLLNETANTK